jgi:hypothetical protein
MFFYSLTPSLANDIDRVTKDALNFLSAAVQGALSVFRLVVPTLTSKFISTCPKLDSDAGRI